MTESGRIRLHLRGPRTAGATELDALLAFGDAFKRALRGVARSPGRQAGNAAGQPVVRRP